MYEPSILKEAASGRHDRGSIKTSATRLQRWTSAPTTADLVGTRLRIEMPVGRREGRLAAERRSHRGPVLAGSFTRMGSGS